MGKKDEKFVLMFKKPSTKMENLYLMRQETVHKNGNFVFDASRKCRPKWKICIDSSNDASKNFEKMYFKKEGNFPLFKIFKVYYQ